MSHDDIAKKIQQRLSFLQPQKLEIIDESSYHAGHLPNGSGGHYRLVVVSHQFKNLNRLARHRLVKTALASLFPQEIHALSLVTVTPKEHASIDERLTLIQHLKTEIQS